MHKGKRQVHLQQEDGKCLISEILYMSVKKTPGTLWERQFPGVLCTEAGVNCLALHAVLRWNKNKSLQLILTRFHCKVHLKYGDNTHKSQWLQLLHPDLWQVLKELSHNISINHNCDLCLFVLQTVCVRAHVYICVLLRTFRTRMFISIGRSWFWFLMNYTKRSQLFLKFAEQLKTCIFLIRCSEVRYVRLQQASKLLKGLIDYTKENRTIIKTNNSGQNFCCFNWDTQRTWTHKAQKS